MALNTIPPKRNIAIYLIMLAVVLSVMITLRHCNSQPENGMPTHAGLPDTLRVAIEYSPLACYTYDDTLGGFGYDAIRLVAGMGERGVMFFPIVRLEDALQGLSDQTYDILVAQFPVTRDNREDYLFSDPLYLDRQVLVQRADSSGQVAVKSQLDLAGRTLWVVKTSPMRDRIESLGREIGDTIYVAEDEAYGPEQLFILVATGEIDFAVMNESVARTLANDYPGVDVETGISFTQFQSFILSKGDVELCDSVNSWLGKLKASPQFKSLAKRYNISI